MFESKIMKKAKGRKLQEKRKWQAKRGMREDGKNEENCSEEK